MIGVTIMAAVPDKTFNLPRKARSEEGREMVVLIVGGLG